LSNGSNPPLRRPFLRHHSFGSKSLEQKEIMECSNLPGIVACAVIPLMGGLALKMVGL